MFDGLRTCDHTNAADPVKVYATVTDCTPGGKLSDNAETPNSGIGNGALAPESTNIPEVVIGAKALYKTAGCCEGDTEKARVNFECVNKAPGRKVIEISVDIPVLVRKR